MKTTVTGAENIHWSRSTLYDGFGDPKLEEHIRQEQKRLELFLEHCGGCGENEAPVADLLKEWIEINRRSGAPASYLTARVAVDQTDSAAARKLRDYNRRIGPLRSRAAKRLREIFRALAPGRLDELAAGDPVVRLHLPYIERLRKGRNSPVLKPETGTGKKVGYASLRALHRVARSELRVRHGGGVHTLQEATNTILSHPDRDRRRGMLTSLNGEVGGLYHRLSAATLNGAIAMRNGSRERNGPLMRRTCRVVTERVAPLIRRYFALKARLMGIPVLAWSDRMVNPLSRSVIAFDEARSLIVAAYSGLDRELARLADNHFELDRIEAAPMPNKRTGAHSSRHWQPDGSLQTFVFMSYFGQPGCLKNLAHEIGHACHYRLSAAAKGPLLIGSPAAFGEVPAQFSENLVLRHMLERQPGTAPRERLETLITLIESVACITVSQIAYTEFERLIHRPSREPFDGEEFDRLFIEARERLFGPDGALFDYADSNRLWTIVPHFQGPFDCWRYAFGELLAHLLMDRLRSMGRKKFAVLYRKLLSVGDTLPLEAMLAPFGIDLRDSHLFDDAIDNGIRAWVDETELLVANLGMGG